ncbi:TIGR01777 family oxidoreductase [Gracilibacillus sp. YIM 98692]|uniref:TIGR01777 family oxidoreductase n=1 Tax=Gracilibacillus sp. YIM 98692 TaxID=2663532 RepID=UPI0013D21B34|nr:TIGR01777 family oxidoreductase [Gracilibacillus sp. YIM 98692]
MQKKVVIAGGTGFIGTYLKEKFQDKGYEVFIISRKEASIKWEDKQAIINALESAEMVINLAGKSVNCRYHKKNKQEILRSRINTTNWLGEAIEECNNPPALWINSSTATIYRHAEDRPMTESNGEIGTGFSVDVAKNWEKAFFAFDLPHTRQIALRTAIVLGPNGGVMTPYKNLVKYSLGGIQGTGKQMFSWIHVEDLWKITQFLYQRDDLEGVFNAAAPNPIQNKQFMQKIRKQMNRNLGLPAPRFLLELGAIVIRTETELVLKSRWVLPERLEQEGYFFTFPTIETTLQDIL